jgi:phage-related protein
MGNAQQNFQKIGNFITKTATGIWDTAKGAVDKVWNFGTGLVNKVADTGSNLVNKVADVGAKVIDKVSDIPGQAIGTFGSIGTILAIGGVGIVAFMLLNPGKTERMVVGVAEKIPHPAAQGAAFGARSMGL